MKVLRLLFFYSVCVFINGCSEEQNEVYHVENTVKHCYPESDDIEQYVDALNSSDIKYEYIKEEKCIYTNSSYKDKLEKIAIDLFGNPPPAGLSMSWGKDKNEKNISLLSENNINTTIYLYHGEEYVSWNLEDAEKVETLLNIQPWKREMLKELREKN